MGDIAKGTYSPQGGAVQAVQVPDRGPECPSPLSAWDRELGRGGPWRVSPGLGAMVSKRSPGSGLSVSRATAQLGPGSGALKASATPRKEPGGDMGPGRRGSSGVGGVGAAWGC